MTIFTQTFFLKKSYSFCTFARLLFEQNTQTHYQMQKFNDSTPKHGSVSYNMKHLRIERNFSLIAFFL